MCGRYTLHAQPDDVACVFAVPTSAARQVLAAGPRFNIAPTTQVAAVRPAGDAGGRELLRLRWGLVPHWTKDPEKGPLLINARAETVAEKPAFRTSFRSRRCLLLADGFYEWRKLPTGKQPYHFKVDEGAVFAFAGIWDRWESDGAEQIDSCAIITTRANELMRPVHDRMPVILGSESWDAWLDPHRSEPRSLEPLQALLHPFPTERMTGFPVSTLVNNPGNDVPACVDPVGPRLDGGSVPI
jgi:putative SOS response-associated peptidase YedK